MRNRIILLLILFLVVGSVSGATENNAEIVVKNDKTIHIYYPDKERWAEYKYDEQSQSYKYNNWQRLDKTAWDSLWVISKDKVQERKTVQTTMLGQELSSRGVAATELEKEGIEPPPESAETPAEEPAPAPADAPATGDQTITPPAPREERMHKKDGTIVVYYPPEEEGEKGRREFYEVKNGGRRKFASDTIDQSEWDQYERDQREKGNVRYVKTSNAEQGSYEIIRSEEYIETFDEDGTWRMYNHNWELISEDDMSDPPGRTKEQWWAARVEGLKKEGKVEEPLHRVTKEGKREEVEEKQEVSPSESHEDAATRTPLTKEQENEQLIKQLVSKKIGTEEERLQAAEAYEKAMTAYETADQNYKDAEERERAAFAAKDIEAMREAQADKRTWGQLRDLAKKDVAKKKVALEDSQFAAKQAEENLNAEYTRQEKGTAVERAKKRQEQYRRLMMTESNLEVSITEKEKEIDDLEDAIEDEEDYETRKQMRDELEKKKKELERLEEKHKTVQTEIKKQEPVSNSDAANIRLNEIRKEKAEIKAENERAAENYATAMIELSRAQSDLRKLRVDQQYQAARAAMKKEEKDQTPEDKEAIKTYQEAIKEAQKKVEEAKKKEEKTRTEMGATLNENEKKTIKLNTEENEVKEAKEVFDLKREIKDLKKREAEAKTESERLKWRQKRLAAEDNLLWKEANWAQRGVIAVYDFVSAYREFKGLGQYSILAMGPDGDEEMAKKREEAATHFCEYILYLAGTKCWQSKICEHFYTKQEMPPGQNILVTEITPGGHKPAASIQAEVSLPITYKEAGKSKTKFVYKITYFIENPHMDQDLTYHIELKGPKTFKSTKSVLSGRKLEEGREVAGGREGKLGADPMIFESNTRYTEACLSFNPRIRKAVGSGLLSAAGFVNEICVPIQQYEGAATRPYVSEAVEEQQQEEEGLTEEFQTYTPAQGINMEGA